MTISSAGAEKQQEGGKGLLGRAADQIKGAVGLKEEL